METPDAKPKWRKSKLLILVATLLGTVFGVIEISNNVNQIVAEVRPSEIEVIDSHFENSLSDLVTVPPECLFNGAEFFNAGGGEELITESKWRSEEQVLDIRFDYTCLVSGGQLSISITSHVLTNPGHASVVGQIANGSFATITLEVLNRGWKDDWCHFQPLAMNVVDDEFAGEIITDEGYKPGCEVISLSSVLPLTSNQLPEIDATASQELDLLIRQRSPASCTFIGAILEDTAVAPEPLRETFDFINTNYMSWEWFAISSATPDQYVFDESLSAKVVLGPRYLYSCGTPRLPYFELYLSGLVEGADGYAWPGPGQINVMFNPAIQERRDIAIAFEAFSADSVSCGEFELVLETSSEFGDWFSHSMLHTGLAGFDLKSCPVLALTAVRDHG